MTGELLTDLSLFVLEDYSRVQRDTRRNLDVLDLCQRYAAEPSDRFALEEYCSLEQPSPGQRFPGDLQ